MNKPLFSIVLITKNEQNVLPRALDSLKEFRNRGGEVVILDTGSEDRTMQIAESYGCKVSRGEMYMTNPPRTVYRKHLSPQEIDEINSKFVFEDDTPIVKGGDSFFHFSAARNAVTKMASNDFVFTMDADEVYTRLDIDKINELILQGYEQFEYQFVYAHDAQGLPSIKFVQSKAFDRRKVQWKGVVHEVLQGASKTMYLDESICLLEHWQEAGKEHRGNYLIGLAYSCLTEPENDRNSFYFGRELMYQKRFHSALREFARHIAMDKWVQEKAQSMIYSGDCLGSLNEPLKQIEHYFLAFHTDPSRREALIKIAFYYKFYENWLAVCCFAKAAMEIPWNDFYGNEISHYRDIPHHLLYVGYGWRGMIPQAQEHINKALEYAPYNLEYLRDTMYYFEYGAPAIEGWMRWPELQFLYEAGKKYDTILELGSWKGRSSHALLSGAQKHGGKVICVDTWQGADDVRDLTNTLAKQEDVFAVFMKNVGQFHNLVVNKKRGLDAAKDYEDNSIDFIFIDAGHTYEDVKADIAAFLPKCRKVLAGHDYDRNTWMGVCQAVDEAFGEPDGVVDSIWWVDLEKRRAENKTYDEITKETDAMVMEFLESKPEQKIPKKIWTAWLSEEPVPEKIQKWIDSQKIEGYEHNLLTLPYIQALAEVVAHNTTADNKVIYEYIHQAISAKKWVKAVDMLRAYFLHEYGGIFLDADMEILPGKNFDDMLHHDLFAGREENGFIGYSLVGAKPRHPVFKYYLEEVPKKWKGDDDQFFQSSMEYFTHAVDQGNYPRTMIYSPLTFFPYNHQTGVIDVTPYTRTYHHFLKSWVKKEDELPRVSIIIPHIHGTRDEGLLQCRQSIDALNYPKNLLNTWIMEGDETVPEKVKKGVNATDWGEYLVYAADDMTFHPDSLKKAIEASIEHKKGLISFHEGPILPDEGNICTHFIIRRDLIPKIGGEIFDTRFHHAGCDNLLWAKCKKLGEAMHHEEALITHNHFSKGATFDEVYAKGWKHVDKDRKLLAELLAEG